MLKHIIKSCLLILLAALCSCAINPVTGEKELMFVSEAQELSIGKEASVSLDWEYGGRFKDPVLERYLAEMVRKIWLNSERPHLPFKFVIENTSLPNAFALPGYVAITRGLLSELENEAHFVAVMGHETAHVMARHTAQRLTMGSLAQLGLVVGSIALEGSTAKDALITTGTIGSRLILLKYDRGQEIQADRLSIKYMAKLGYDPKEAISAHERLDIAADSYLKRAGKKRGEDTFINEILSTHPRSETRQQEIQSMINEVSPYRIIDDGKFTARFRNAISGIRKVNSAYFLYDEAERQYNKERFRDAKEKVYEAISVNAEQAPFYNLLGMIEVKQKDYNSAEASFRNALSLDPEYQPSYYGLGLTELMRGKYQEAISEFKKSLELYPTHPGSYFGIGKSHVYLRNWDKAVQYLKKVEDTYPGHDEVHGLLGICYENTGDRKKAVAEYALQVRIAPNTEMGRYAKARLTVLQ